VVNNAISSANNNINIDNKRISFSVKLLISIQSLMSFMNKINHKGDNGSPCFTPNVTSNSSE